MKLGLVCTFDNSCSDTLNYDVVYTALLGIANSNLWKVVAKLRRTVRMACELRNHD